ncbi:MAG TPA: hypothetical protein VGN52_06825 [Burkholderiales bacterium]|jgi:hypothetical protein
MSSSSRVFFLAMTLAWFVGTVAFLTFELIRERDGFFVERAAPAGTVWQGRRIAFPGKGAYTFREDERLCLVARLRDIDTGARVSTFFQPAPSPWSCLTSVPVPLAVRWLRLLLWLGGGTALLLWLGLGGRGAANEKGAGPI